MSTSDADAAKTAKDHTNRATDALRRDNGSCTGQGDNRGAAEKVGDTVSLAVDATSEPATNAIDIVLAATTRAGITIRRNLRRTILTTGAVALAIAAAMALLRRR
ncbi:hypothetical protein FHS07_003244 [Microbacterium proteolyticum]|uniref:Uncharacterized protein n=1 Tax=Microbacterium proteolyticum TaxID=1572644 RepID=A0A7W5CLH3_9MICO|nr:hypothetical protein [Microbacterium proteolyticum]MBB3159509.1 hypothetical protein [Microbacterium proteolyticum]